MPWAFQFTGLLSSTFNYISGSSFGVFHRSLTAMPPLVALFFDLFPCSADAPRHDRIAFLEEHITYSFLCVYLGSVTTFCFVFWFVPSWCRRPTPRTGTSPLPSTSKHSRFPMGDPLGVGHRSPSALTSHPSSFMFQSHP